MGFQIKKFDDFVKRGVVKLHKPDRERARFLMLESKKDYDFLKQVVKSFKINNENANSIIKLSYDALMELVRAAMFCNGLSCQGVGAHEAEISYLVELGFSKDEAMFMDQLRYLRNRVVYYGKVLDTEYAEKVFSFLKKVYDRLKKIVDDKLKEVIDK